MATPEGVVRCRTVKGMTESQRWDAELVESIKGKPWNLRGEYIDEGEELGEERPSPEHKEPESIMKEPVAEVRRFRLDP